MYTWTSKFVSPELEKKIKVHASAMRWLVKLEQEEKNRDFLAGSRFNDDDQVFQSFCQEYLTTEEKAKASQIDPEALPKMVEQALINAGECDYYYMYEKQW